MGDAPGRRAHAVLKRLVAVDADLRDREAERLCAGDEALLRDVRRLLAALSRNDGFLEVPVGRAMREPLAPKDGADAPAFPVIPGFTVVRLLGVGGMAAVYEATQELPRRRVALKVLRRSMAGAAALRRFEFETEVLARLRHPGIAQIHEVGTFDDGAGAIPFFAMEYVESARSLTDFCKERSLGLPERLALFVQVCDAVQHGHQNGVIHRDLKPGNVLVDRDGRPRVIDFGIARSSADGGQHGQTTVGQIIGTLNAMSPEQCTPNAVVDARTDVYSLGVLLYEMLCHRPPHELASLPVPEALRIIHDVAPTRPSAVAPGLRGDLEAIILKAIEKAPERRYATVAALGADVRRYLADESVEARSPTLLYQLRLFARRNRAVVVAASVAAAALVAVTAVSVVSALRVQEELSARVAAEAKANDERDTALRKTYIANFAGALAAVTTNEYIQVAQLLEAAPEQFRGWEWRWLDALANQSRVSMQAHRVNVLAMGLDASGRRVVTVARDGSVSSRDAATLAPSGGSTSAGDSISAAIALSDGEHVAIITRDARAVVRRTDGEGPDRGLDPALGGCAALGQVGDTTLLAAMDTGELVRWDVAAGSVERTGVRGARPAGMQVSPDRRFVALWSGARVSLRDATSLAETQSWEDELDVGTVLLRPDLDRVLVGHENGQVAVRSLSDGRQIVRLGMRDRVSLVRALAMSRDGSRLVAGQGSGVITLIELPSTAGIGQFLGHRDAIIGLGFVDGGIVSASWDGTVRLWDDQIETVEFMSRIDAHEGRVLSVAFDHAADGPRAERLVSAGTDATARILHAGSFEPGAVLRGSGGDLYDAEFSPDGTLVATAGGDRVVRLWDAESGNQLAALEGHEGSVWSVDFSPDGTLLASGGDDRTVRVWDVASRRALNTLVGHEERVIDVRFSHDGRRIASASRDATVRLWDLADPRRPRVLLGHEWDVFAAVWSRDDAELYTGSRDQTIRVWSTETGREVAVIRDLRQFVTSLALSPDGSRLAAGTWFGSVVLVDPRRRETVATVKAISGTVRGVSFSGDGHVLAIAGSDGMVRLMDDRPPSERPKIAAGE